MSEQAAIDAWLLADDEGLLWECPKCHTQYKLERGNPETTGLNFCPVCGTELKLPRS